ncbi:acid sphingomyelinase-like phosphodiesterase 3b [Artemia franciscana]|uniref:Sphingomyelin phosphodiesterase n=1 Tax=Artemia franciscana TaxID=6661 RepID=A0AA88I7A9_ARTSF|nr:hypothetical protein QYM36_001745 [Artemia franciscana]KAK2723171.1 hypothetical protein QYM36_001745 [Artemia franciscana]
MILLWTLCLTLGGQIMARPEQMAEPKGLFWQLTDVHWDREYSSNGDPKKMCHRASDGLGVETGKFGTYSCDSPWELVEASIAAMTEQESDPDFIVWTGDNSPHVKDPIPDWDYVFSSLKKVTDLLRDQFPRSQIIPVLGNHDVYPEDFYPGKTGGIYEAYLKEGGWEDLLSNRAKGSFGACGFYSTMPNKGLKVLVLNTNLYNVPDNLTSNIEDPCGQFTWMERELKKAERAGTKVLVAAHIPPGYFERFVVSPFYNEIHNKKYINLLNDYGDVILAHVYGHTHTDSFRLFRTDENDEVKSIAFIAPSVTPWLHSGGVNPSIRLYGYEPYESHITDFWQYFLNLTEINEHLNTQVSTQKIIPETDENLLAEKSRMYRSWASRPIQEIEPYLDSSNELEVLDYRNKEKKAGDLKAHKRSRRSEGPGWKLLYRATDFYNVPSLKNEYMHSVYKRLKTDEDFFGQFYGYNTGGYVFETCDSKCKREHICAMGHLHNRDMEACLNQSISTEVSNYNIGKSLPSNATEVVSENQGSDIVKLLTVEQSTNKNTHVITVVCSIVFVFCAALIALFMIHPRNKYRVLRSNWRHSYEPIEGNVL